MYIHEQSYVDAARLNCEHVVCLYATKQSAI